MAYTTILQEKSAAGTGFNLLKRKGIPKGLDQKKGGPRPPFFQSDEKEP
jgi:hypothetical protein